MTYDDDRLSWEENEIAGLARRFGGKRVYRDGIGAWEFPPWLCPHCTPIGGPETPPLPGCPQPLARHGPVERTPEG